MNIQDAQEIVNLYEYWSDKSCSCFMGNPPCGKCVNCPSDEDYMNAVDYLLEYDD